MGDGASERITKNEPEPKRENLPRMVSTGIHAAWKTTSHLASFTAILKIGEKKKGHAHDYGLRSSTARPVCKSTGTEI